MGVEGLKLRSAGLGGQGPEIRLTELRASLAFVRALGGSQRDCQSF